MNGMVCVCLDGSRERDLEAAAVRRLSVLRISGGGRRRRTRRSTPLKMRPAAKVDCDAVNTTPSSYRHVSSRTEGPTGFY